MDRGACGAGYSPGVTKSRLSAPESRLRLGRLALPPILGKGPCVGDALRHPGAHSSLATSVACSRAPLCGPHGPFRGAGLPLVRPLAGRAGPPGN